MRKYQTNPDEGRFTKNLTSTFQKCQGHEEQRKAEKLSQIGRLEETRRHDD